MSAFPPPPPPPPQQPAGWSPPAPPVPAVPDEFVRVPGSRRGRRTLLAGGALTLMVALVAGGVLAFRIVVGAGDALASLVPIDTAVYVSVYLDPPASQKLALAGLMDRFPTLSGASHRDELINGTLDSALQPLGLNHSDVRPWLGQQLAVVVPARAFGAAATGDSKHSPPLAVLISTSDDSLAQAALDRLRVGPLAKGTVWSSSTHGGVAVSVGRHAATSDTVTWAIVHHTAVMATSTGLVNDVIDTAQGQRPNLQSSAGFSTVSAQLPGDRLALAYVDVPAVVAGLKTTLPASSSSAFGQLDAYRGAGLSLSAHSDGLAINGVSDFDAGKMTAAQRAVATAPPHSNGAMGFVPPSSYGVIAMTGLRQTIQSAVDQFAGPGDSDVAKMLAALGLTGPDGIIGHLTGDAGIEIDQSGHSSVPAGSFIFGTDSSTAAQHFFATLAAGGCHVGTTCAPAQETTQNYHGVTITSLGLGGFGSSGVDPSWAISDSVAILGSTPDEVRATLDAHSGGSIASSSRFSGVMAHVPSATNGLMYLDISKIASAVRDNLPPADQRSYDHQLAPYVDHIKALAITDQNAADHTGISMFIQVG